MSSAPPAGTRRRASEIAKVAAKHGFGYLFETGPLARMRPSHEDDPAALSSRAQRLRDMLAELGPTWVKLGQLLSLRPDIVPPDITLGLRELQDHVAPVPYEQAVEVIESELGLSVERLFLEFGEQPIAAASIGQVHRAVLPNGHHVVVKVQRPDAPRQIEADLALMNQVARIVKERVSAASFIDPVALVGEFARTIRGELDYRREASNAERFARDFADDPNVLVPAVWRSYSTARVLTLEYLDGATLADLDYDSLSLDERRRIAYLAAETWLTMIFRNGFFHGDPHPANVMVVDGRIGLLDFGMAGALTSNDLSNLTALFIDAVRRNVSALPGRLAALGVHFPREQEDQFVHELELLFDRYYGVRVSDLDPIQLIREAFGLIFRMHLELPTRFVLVDRSIATLSAVGLELYPDFNVFEVARPYARELMLERFDPRRVAERARREVGSYGRVARELPFQLHDVLQEVRDGQVEVGIRLGGLEYLIRDFARIGNRFVIAVVVAAGILGSAIIAAAGTGKGLQAIAIAGFVVSILMGLWLVWGVIRSGRL